MWVNWQWRGLSCNCLFFNPSKLVNQWQNPLINPSNARWALAKIVNPHKACSGLLSRPDIYCIPLCSPRHHGGTLTSSITGQQVLVFFLVPKWLATRSSWCLLVSSVLMISETYGKPWWYRTPLTSYQSLTSYSTLNLQAYSSLSCSSCSLNLISLMLKMSGL